MAVAGARRVSIGWVRANVPRVVAMVSESTSSARRPDSPNSWSVASIAQCEPPHLERHLGAAEAPAEVRGDLLAVVVAREVGGEQAAPALEGVLDALRAPAGQQRRHHTGLVRPRPVERGDVRVGAPAHLQRAGGLRERDAQRGPGGVGVQAEQLGGGGGGGEAAEDRGAEPGAVAGHGRGQPGAEVVAQGDRGEQVSAGQWAAPAARPGLAAPAGQRERGGHGRGARVVADVADEVVEVEAVHERPVRPGRQGRGQPDVAEAEDRALAGAAELPRHLDVVLDAGRQAARGQGHSDGVEDAELRRGHGVGVEVREGRAGQVVGDREGEVLARGVPAGGRDGGGGGHGRASRRLIGDSSSTGRTWLPGAGGGTRVNRRRVLNAGRVTARPSAPL
jgi:hypothetical protein